MLPLYHGTLVNMCLRFLSAIIIFNVKSDVIFDKSTKRKNIYLEGEFSTPCYWDLERLIPTFLLILFNIELQFEVFSTNEKWLLLRPWFCLNAPTSFPHINIYFDHSFEVRKKTIVVTKRWRLSHSFIHSIRTYDEKLKINRKMMSLFFTNAKMGWPIRFVFVSFSLCRWTEKLKILFVGKQLNFQNFVVVLFGRVRSYCLFLMFRWELICITTWGEGS